MSADIRVNRLPDVPDPIAVVGIGCRFPGASNLSEFWRVLSKGENHIVTVPPDRWVDKDFFNENPDVVGKSYINKAGFIKGYLHELITKLICFCHRYLSFVSALLFY